MKKKVAIGLPCSFPMVYEDFMASVLQMDKGDYGIELFRARTGHDIAILRNGIVQVFLKSECSHLLMIDTDMIIHKDALINMIERNVDIVGALYFMRYPPFNPCAVRFDLNHKVPAKGEQINELTMEELVSKRLIEVNRVGTGCILVKREVFETVKYPWFHTRTKNGNIIMSDDYYFCDKARASNYKVYVDTSVPCQHLSNAAIDIGWYVKFGQQSKGERKNG